MNISITNLQRAKRLGLRKLRQDLSRALGILGLGEAELSVLFVNRRRMRLLNARYREIDRDTDVLSFPMLDAAGSGQPVVLGDIVVCVPRAVAQAAAYGVPLHDEIMRLLVHGLLHLMGYDHEAGPYRKKKMHRKEREVLHALSAVAEERELRD